MLFALLYNHQDQVLAAAPACDHAAMGDRYWLECHRATVSEADMFATAYREIRDPYLQQRLLELGVNDSVLSSIVTKEIEAMDLGGIQQRAA